MKPIFWLLIIGILSFSCTKKEGSTLNSPSEESKKIDSINLARTKINDSIRILNNKNHFKDFSGTHRFNHLLIKNNGSATFKKIGRDEYEVSGKSQSGSNFITIEGIAKVVSEKHLNFTGSISQSISENDNGKVYHRKGTKTFLSKDGGKTWRLQDMVNSSGFVDYIDIQF